MPEIAGPTFTVLGASGFVGSNLVRWLGERNISCWSPSRGEVLLGNPLGHVIYCIGLTADFRARPFDTVRAHVCRLPEILEQGEFESFLYLSSTRVYAAACAGAEDTSLVVDPVQPDDLYNISKIMGEALCLSSKRSGVRVARLSNVYGRDFSSNNFLSSIFRDAIRHNRVLLRTSMESEKDYISVQDVISLLPRIALAGKHRIYNVASGINTSNGAIVQQLQRITGCAIEVGDEAPTVRFPTISIDRLRQEFGFQPSQLRDSLAPLIHEYQQWAS